MLSMYWWTFKTCSCILTMYCALLSSVQRLPECPFEEKLLFEQFIVRSLGDLHQPAGGEHSASPAARRVPHRAVHLRAPQRGRLCPQGLHREAVRNGVCVFCVQFYGFAMSSNAKLALIWFYPLQGAGWWNLCWSRRWCTNQWDVTLQNERKCYIRCYTNGRK